MEPQAIKPLDAIAAWQDTAGMLHFESGQPPNAFGVVLMVVDQMAIIHMQNGTYFRMVLPVVPHYRQLADRFEVKA